MFAMKSLKLVSALLLVAALSRSANAARLLLVVSRVLNSRSPPQIPSLSPPCTSHEPLKKYSNPYASRDDMLCVLPRTNTSPLPFSSISHLPLQESNSTSASSGGGEFSGDGTAYSDTVSDGTGFACSYRFLNPWARSNFAAMNAAQWDDGQSCGKCVSVRCTDSRCTKHDPVTVYIVDKVSCCSIEYIHSQ